MCEGVGVYVCEKGCVRLEKGIVCVCVSVCVCVCAGTFMGYFYARYKWSEVKQLSCIDFIFENKAEEIT